MNKYVNFPLRRRSLGALIALFATWIGGPRAARAAVGADPSSTGIGDASLVAGKVLLSRGKQDAVPLWQGARLFEGDRVDTRDDGELHISFEDGGYLALRPNSALTIDAYVVTGAASDSAALRLLRGALRSVTGWIGKLEPNRYSLAATTVFVGVRGTDHEVIIVAPEDAAPGMDAGVHNRVNEGGTTLRNDKGTIDIAPGSAAYAPGSGAAPRAHVGMPAFFDQRHTSHEQAAAAHAQNIRQHMEDRLRARGKLQPHENFDDFRKRQPASPRGPQGRPAQREPLQRSREPGGRQAGRDAASNRENRQESFRERLRERQEARAARPREGGGHEERERRR